MNILYLTNELNYSDGVSSHLYYLTKELKKNQDIEITIICGGGDAVSKFEQLGILVHSAKEFNHNRRSIINFFRSMKMIKKFIKLNKVRILHSHNHYAANMAFYLSRNYAVKTIQTIHGIFPDGGKLKHLRSGHYIAVNDHIREHILSKGISDSQNVSLIYNGVDFDSGIQKKASAKKQIIAASRLEEGKGMELFIEAVSKLPNEYSTKADFFIAGTGSKEEGLKNMNTKLNAGIKFLGNITNLRKLFDTTDIFVIPSEAEGLPITLLEASASNNLIVSSDFHGIKSILKDDTFGLVFKMNDAEDLIDKIRFALDNSQKSEMLSGNFSNYARDVFNSEIMALKHLSLYTQLLNH